MVIRAFSVRADKKELVNSLSNKLDDKLIELQRDGWEIMQVESTPCREWDYPKYFDSTLFTIIAKHD